MMIQYHDVIKPVYLYAVVKMIMTHQTSGLPTNIIENMPISSLLEWYINRRYINPLQQLDWQHRIDPSTLDEILYSVLDTDESIYQLAPRLNIDRIFYVYRQQHMSFPIYVYSEREEPAIRTDIKQSLSGITAYYVHGDLRSAIKKCGQNFTYIFSDISLLATACDILKGTFAHVLLTKDYRYNTSWPNTFKYDMQELMSSHPFIRLGTTQAMDLTLLANAFDNISLK